MRDCVLCLKHINTADDLTCTKCRAHFHYQCVNFSQDDFTANKQDIERIFVCLECQRLTRRIRNDDTPIKHTIVSAQTNQESNDILFNETGMSIDEQILDDRSVLGDTQHPEQTTPTPPDNASITITYGEISQLFDLKLKKHSAVLYSKIDEIKSIVRDEIVTATHKLEQKFMNYKQEIDLGQQKLRQDIENLAKSIEDLQSERKKLKKDIQDLQNRSLSFVATPNIGFDNKIVLYGIEEIPWETEEDLYNCLLATFKETLNVNLAGYVEDIFRIGKRGNRRPIVIELVSKKMVKYLLQNKRYFNKTGKAISEYLDEKSLEHRNKLRQILYENKKQGKRAEIRNNKLYIEGTEYNGTDQTTNQPPLETNQQNYSIPRESQRTTYSSAARQSFR
ncbi:hypothetical protein O0L34_g40 [Tuta absoluta]|nr:hypothetical protein O0L34_g40 [Tuta absoluta]